MQSCGVEQTVSQEWMRKVQIPLRTLSTVSSVYVASAAAGSQVPMFEKIRALAKSPHGIWLATAHSSLLQLWRDGQCEMLFDIRYDHSHRHAK